MSRDGSPYPLVHVTWLDSAHNRDGWDDLADVTTAPIRCESVGWLTHDGADCITVTPHIGTHGDGRQGCGDMTIPRIAILTIWSLDIQRKLP